MKTSVRIAAAAIAAMAAYLSHVRPADAALTKTCHWRGDPNIPWFQPKTTVDFWITTDSRVDPIAATGVSTGEFTNALAQAINIWNEESGASIKLRYRGFTSFSDLTGGVVIIGGLGNLGEIRREEAPSTWDVGFYNNRFSWGRIYLFKNSLAGAPIAWTTSPTGGGTDLVAVLVHEIGHAVFNMDHLNSTTNADCVDFGQLSVTRGYGSRVLSNYDIEVAQGRYGSRADYSRFYYSRMTGPTSWQAVIPDAAYLRPLFRPGSMGQRANDPWFGWIYGAGTAPQSGGAGRADVARYSNIGVRDWSAFTPPDGALGRPIAMAYRPAGFVPSELLVAYEKVPAGTDIYHSLDGQICYRISTNEGLSWSGEVCPAGALAGTYGLTASYDWYSSSFVIAFVRNAPPSRNLEIAVLAVPTSEMGGAPQLTHLGISSTHAPGIACGGYLGRSNCMLAYRGADRMGVLSWTKVEVQPTVRVASIGPVSTSSYFIYDTPSVILAAGDNTFRLAYTVGSSAIYSYKMDAISGTSWTGTGDIYNVPGTQLSSPVLYPHPSGTVQAWFIKYW